MEQKRYVLVRDYHSKDGIVAKGTELTLFRGGLYINGGLCHPGYVKELMNLIKVDLEEHFYLKEVQIINNKV